MGRYFWSDQEDNRLRKLVQACNAPDWKRIAQEIGSRTARQCRERYKNFLAPNLNKKDITPKEGARIERLVEEMGHNWADVARRLGSHRTGNAVKNWWHKNQNRLQRLASQQRLMTGYEDRYNQNGPGLFTTTRCLPLPRTQPPPPTLPPEHRHPVHPIEAGLSPLRSPKPAEAGAKPPHTTSPARHHLVLYELGELPPLPLPNVPAMVDLQLPGQLPGIGSPVFPAYRDRVESQPQRPSLSLQGQLPIAPDISPRKDRARSEGDSRMKMSAILC
ncbi:hypothetical protein BHE90_017462 [Fusarium euwallaceae]|uniref:Myb-like DNA-binding protein myb-1 n=1 Tax=Fusarium euwallaceae TaxID=1147111 RepID=A0A430KXE1_9HYPO|nr:hypothetical protein BHE90_017462 [Fusarium euwallaceae]